MNRTCISSDISDEAATASGPASRVSRVLKVLGRAERAIESDPGQARILIGEASRLLKPAAVASLDGYRPELAPWQKRAVIGHIDGHLDQTIRIPDLAEIVGLSIGHFSRCFKGSFGVSPHDYVIRSRLERAKALMRQSRSPLSQIALDSGFADQAHMSRMFHAIVGSTPTRWRRAQASGLM